MKKTVKKAISKKEVLTFTPDGKLWGNYFAKRNKLVWDFADIKKEAYKFDVYLNKYIKLFKIVPLEKDKKKLKLKRSYVAMSNYMFDLFDDEEMTKMGIRYTLMLILMEKLHKFGNDVEQKLSALTTDTLALKTFIEKNPKDEAKIKKSFKKLDKLIASQKQLIIKYKKDFKDIRKITDETTADYKKIKHLLN